MSTKRHKVDRTPDQKKKSLGKANHQPRHQFLTTSASPPAPNQQGLANFPDLPMSSSPTLPSEWADGGSGSAGSIRRAPLRARRVRPLCRSCGTSCRRPDMLVMSLSPRWGQPLTSRPPPLTSRPFQPAFPRITVLPRNLRSHEAGEAVQRNLLQQFEEAVQQMYLLSPLNKLPSEPTQ